MGDDASAAEEVRHTLGAGLLYRIGFLLAALVVAARFGPGSRRLWLGDALEGRSAGEG